MKNTIKKISIAFTFFSLLSLHAESDVEKCIHKHPDLGSAAEQDCKAYEKCYKDCDGNDSCQWGCVSKYLD